MSSEREPLIAGFDVGGTSVRAALVAVDGRLVGSTIDEPRRPDALGQVRDLRERLVAEAAAGGRTVVRTGLCVAGSVEAGTGRIASAPTAPALVGLQPREPGSGLGIDALANLFNPEVVVVGGGVADVSDLFLEDLRAAARKHMTTVTGRDARIVVGGLGRFAGVAGVAALASTGVWDD